MIEVREKGGATRIVGRAETGKKLPTDDVMDMSGALEFIKQVNLFWRDKTGKWTAAKADTAGETGPSKKLAELNTKTKDEPPAERAPETFKVTAPPEKGKAPLPSLEEAFAILKRDKERNLAAKRAQRAPEPKKKEYDSWDKLDDLPKITPECKAEYDKIIARDFPEFAKDADVEPDSPVVVSSSNNEGQVSDVVTKESVVDENANVVEPRRPVEDAVLSSVMTKEVSKDVLKVAPIVPSCDDYLPDECLKDVVKSVEDKWPSDFAAMLADMPYGLEEESGPTVEQEMSRPYVIAKEMLGSLEKSLLGPQSQEPRELTPIERGIKTPSADMTVLVKLLMWIIYK